MAADRALRVVVAFAVAFLVSSSSVAAHAVSIDEYRVTLRPDASGARARVTLELAYRASHPGQRGFHVVGSAKPTGLRVTDADGGPLHALVKSDHGATWRIEYALPEPDASGLRVVTVAFDQDLQRTYGLDGTHAELDWAHRFEIPVGPTTLRIVGPSAREADGFLCVGDAEMKRCERTAPAPFAMRVPLAPASRAWRLVWVLAAFTGLAAIVHAAARRRTELIAERGILGSTTSLAYPDDDTTFRPAVVLPDPLAARARLSESDRLTLGFKAVGALGLFVAGQVLVLRFLAGPFELAAVLAAFAVATSIPLVLWIRSEDATMWLVAAIVPAGTTFLVLNLQESASWIALLLVLVPVLWLAPRRRPRPWRDAIIGTTASSCGGGGRDDAHDRGGGCGG